MFDPKRAVKSQMIAGLSLAVYAAVAWAAANFFDAPFWWVFGGLSAARAFFGLIERVATFLNWRFFGRAATVQGFLTVLRVNNFPLREQPHDDFLGYLARITDDYEEKSDFKRAAKEFESLLALTESLGILAGMRMLAASDAALDLYSPKGK